MNKRAATRRRRPRPRYACHDCGMELAEWELHARYDGDPTTGEVLFVCEECCPVHGPAARARAAQEGEQ